MIPSFKKIETITQLLEWARVVNTPDGQNIKNLVVLQDIYGHSEVGSLKTFAMSQELKPHRSLIWHAIYVSMGWDTLEQYVKWTAQQFINTQIEIDNKDFDLRETSLFKKQEELKEARKFIYKKIQKVESENKNLKQSLNWYGKEYTLLNQKCREIKKELKMTKKQAANFKQIQQLLLGETHEKD